MSETKTKPSKVQAKTFKATMQLFTLYTQRLKEANSNKAHVGLLPLRIKLSYHLNVQDLDAHRCVGKDLTQMSITISFVWCLSEGGGANTRP